MARIVRGKGVDLVVEASPYLDDSVKVSIAGAGELLNTLKARVVDLNQERKVKFYGWVAGIDKQELIQAADVFCHPTQLDAMPMNILEAMANGLPVVALNWGPITDLVPDQKAGILVEDADPKKIAHAINVLEDTKLRKKMGQEAKLWVLENYTSQKIGIRLHEAFTGMISQ
jgi:glycosyltransferase involved in cell wall biosynthesis